MMTTNLSGKWIKKDYFLVVIVSLFFIIYNAILWLLLSNNSIILTESIIILLIASVIPSYIFMLYSVKKHFGIVRFYFIFLVLTILFYYGQHILVIMDKGYLMRQNHTILDGRINNQSIINASFLIIQSILLIHVGYFSTIKFDNFYFSEDVINKNGIDKSVYKSFKIVAWILFIVSAIAMIIKLSYLIHLNQTYGYLERRILETSDNFTAGLGNFALYLSEWFFPSIYMLFIFNTRKINNKMMYIIVGAFSLLYLMSGSRFLLLKLAMGIFLIQYIWIKPLSIKNLKRITTLGVIGVILLKIISLSRSMTDISLNSILNVFYGLWSDGMFSGILWETGITFTSVSNIIDKAPSVIPFFNGKSYIGAILIFLPSFMRFGFFETYNLSVSATFSPLYYNTNLIGYGSSFITEAYYNFGYFMLIFMLFIGILFGKLENALFRARLSRNAPVFFLITYILSELIYTVRNDIYSIPRYTVFYAIFPLLIYKVLNNFLKVRKRNILN